MKPTPKQKNTSIEEVNEFIRDTCSVYPCPKSEMRRRLNNIIKQTLQNQRDEMIKKMKKVLTPPKKWKESLKSYNGKEEICALCGFNPKRLKEFLIKTLTP